MMLSDVVLKTIAKVSSQEEFDDLLNNYDVSEAPLELRSEAKRELKAQHPQFDKVDKLPTAELYQEMKDGESDISDMGGFGN